MRKFSNLIFKLAYTITIFSKGVLLGSALDPAERPAIIIDPPADKRIYYIPESQSTPLPWIAANRDLVILAINKSALGHAPGLASNVFYVSDEWAEKLKTHARGTFVRLYYLINGDLSRGLWACSAQELLEEAIRSSGYRFKQNLAPNVFSISAESASTLPATECKKLPLAYVVEDEAPYQTPKTLPEKEAMLLEAIISSGEQHAIGQPKPNVFKITKEWGLRLNKEVRDALDKAAGKKLYIITAPIENDVVKKHSSPSACYWKNKGGKFYVKCAWTCDNSALIRTAILDSNLGLAYEDNIFYVRGCWLSRLKDRHLVDFPDESSCCIQ